MHHANAYLMLKKKDLNTGKNYLKNTGQKIPSHQICGTSIKI